MRISIFGSYYTKNTGDWKFRAKKEDFAECCRQLAQQLAPEHSIVVYGSVGEHTADYYFVEGIMQKMGKRKVKKPLIEVICRKGSQDTFRRFAKENPSLFSFHSKEPLWREGAHILTVQESDVILTVGGGKGTWVAGMVALVAKKKLVPVASFGGASAQLLEAAQTVCSGETLEKYKCLNSPWSTYALEQTIELLGVNKTPHLLIIHGRSKDWLQLKNWLQDQAGLERVVVMQEVFGEGRTLPEKWESLASEVDGAIALATPDDIGRLADEGESKAVPRMRQNALIEIGWFWGRLGRSRVMALCKGTVDIPTDFKGIEFYNYDEAPTERADDLRAFLKTL
jgi:CAP12/Pycsar effector protein, TIR domain